MEDPRVSVYDTETGVWKAGAKLPLVQNANGGLREFSLATVGGKIYILGGETQDHRLWGTVFEYDPSADRWFPKAPMPAPRKGAAVAVIGDLVYVAGGARKDGDAEVCVQTLEIYDPITNDWATRSPIPTARCAAVAAALDGKFYIIGGTNGTGTLSSVEEYDPILDRWTPKSGLRFARTAAAAAVVDAKLYVLGGVGEGGTALAKVEIGQLPSSASALSPPLPPQKKPQLIQDLEQFAMELLKNGNGVFLYSRGGYGMPNVVRGIVDPENLQTLYGVSVDDLKGLRAESTDALRNLGYNFNTS